MPRVLRSPQQERATTGHAVAEASYVWLVSFCGTCFNNDDSGVI